MAEKIIQLESKFEEVELKKKGKEIPDTAKIIGNPKKVSASVKKMSEVKETRFSSLEMKQEKLCQMVRNLRKKVPKNSNVSSATMNVKSPIL